jgi:hypothetical protein
MAQTFVFRNDLIVEDQDNPVRVAASYPEAIKVDIGLHGDQCTVMTIADNYILNDMDNGRIILKSGWRDNYKPVLAAEASRRIYLVFPEFKQRNYTASVQNSITTYGADTTLWPPDQQDVKVEGDRGWQYVSDVRSASNAWTGMPTDPTADEIWPPSITPIK